MAEKGLRFRILAPNGAADDDIWQRATRQDVQRPSPAVRRRGQAKRTLVACRRWRAAMAQGLRPVPGA